MSKKNSCDAADIRDAFAYLTMGLSASLTKADIMRRSQTACFLITRYPTLANYITTCIRERQYEQLIDFLFALETDNVVYYN